MRYLLLFAVLLSLSVTMTAHNEGKEGVKASEVSQQSPSFLGGEKRLSSFLSANIQYPYIAKTEEIQGRVIVQFNVMPDGSITDVKVTESVHPALDKEAIRVVKSMPRWIPGKNKDGKPIIVPFTMPINFRLPVKFYSIKTHQLNTLVIFEQDRSTIDKSQSASIRKIGTFMLLHPEDTLVIKGYTRIAGDSQQCLKLSKTRADVVKKELLKRYDLDASHIIANGMGATKKFDSKGDLNDVVLFYLYEKNKSTNPVDTTKQKEDETERDKAIALYDAILPMPCFPDGPLAMSQFITNHLQYPESAKKDSIQGNVFVSFNVEKDGAITDLKVVRSVSPELDNEACRLVNNMPKWIPAMKNGIPTSARYVLPVKFSLGDTGIQRSNPQKVNQTKTRKGDKTVLPDSIDAMPEFPGGQATLFTFLSNNIKYPVLAEEAGVQGRVILTFVVDVDGSITEIKVRKSVDPSLDKEALRVVSNMPRWIPGKIDGIPVRVEYILPTTFRLQ